MAKLENYLMTFSQHTVDENAKFFDCVKDYYNHHCSSKNVDTYKGAEFDAKFSLKEKDAKMHDMLLDRVSRLSGIDKEMMKSNPMAFATNPLMGWATFAVIQSTIDVVLPDAIIRDYGLVAEVRNAALGDTLKFRIRPRDYFVVSKHGRKQRTANLQKQFSGDMTLEMENRQVSVQVNLYDVIIGRESLAEFMFKAVRSLEIELTKDIYMAFDKATKELPATPEGGELQITGWATDTAIALAQKVSAWNGGTPVVFVGTKLALSKVLPTNDANYRYLLESDYVRLGYIRTAYGYDMIELPQVADWSTPFQTLLDDDVIYVMPVSGDKLVKVAIGENGVSHQSGTYDYANLIQTGTVSKEYGVGVITSALVGRINLA